MATVSSESGSSSVRLSGLTAAIVRPHHQVEAVLAQSLLEMGRDGRVWQAWRWVLNDDQPSPVTLSLASGSAPSRADILAEADADPVGSTAPPGVPTDFCDQLREVRRLLRWLIGESDEIPVDGGDRGELIGAHGDYARTDDEIRQVRDAALCGLQAFDLPDPMDTSGAMYPWRWPPAWMNAAWLQGVRDLLNWVLGDDYVSPMRGRFIVRPDLGSLDFEEEAADEVAQQGLPGGIAVDPEAYPPPQYGEAVQATIAWLRGEVAVPPVSGAGHGPYTAGSDTDYGAGCQDSYRDRAR